MKEEKYHISLCIKREDDRFLGVKDIPSDIAKELGVRTLYRWLKDNEAYPLILTHEEALYLVDKIMAAKMSENLHDLDTWTFLKMQACIGATIHQPSGPTDYVIDWALCEHDHPVYIGLHRIADGYEESQWSLEFDESQKRPY